MLWHWRVTRLSPEGTVSNPVWFLSLTALVAAAAVAAGAQTPQRVSIGIVQNRSEGPAVMERGLAERLRQLGHDVSPTATVSLTPEEDRQYGAWNSAEPATLHRPHAQILARSAGLDSADRRCMMQAMPRVPPLDRPATYDDLTKVSDLMVAEIVDGELHASPRPGPVHTMAGSVMGSRLLPPFQEARGGPGGWWILDEPELHLGSDVLVPDLAGWRRARMPHLPKTAFLPLAPDWICEVLSPSTASLDRAKKLTIYARETWRTPGCLIRWRGRSKCCVSRAGSGYSSPRMPARTSCGPTPSPRLPLTSPLSGRTSLRA